MTGRPYIFIFWVLLLVPALILAGVAFRLLSHEQERIRQSSTDALMDQARVIARSIDLSLETVQENLTGALLELASKEIENRLVSWEKQNPLVRNVFIYHPENGLEYPERSMAATREERQFIDRFSPLFSGRLSFEFNRLSKEGGRVSSREKLYNLSRQPEPGPDQPDSGWIPWFSDNRLYILGWVQKKNTGPVYGVELELMTLLSRLVAQVPEINRPGTALVIMDGSGIPIHQSGSLNTAQANSPAGKIMISRHLPHWSITAFTDKGTSGTGRSFLIVSLILVGILLTAIISGGILITRLTLEKIKDARQKTSFVAAVSHELKTPLTSIRMYAELLLSKRVIPEKQHHYLGVIVGESSRLTRLINNVLDFGKLEQGKKKYHPTPFDMAVFLEELIHTHALRIQTAGIEIIRDFSSGNFTVVTDRDAMEQAVLNLLDNALKYAGQGQFIKFILTRESNDILVTLQDDGPGIAMGIRDKVFQKFFRADNSLTAVQPGSGLGLSIARQMLRDLGGDLTIDPEASGGACFTIRIPCYETD